MPKRLSNHEIVTLAVFLLGGDSRCIDTEDIAVKANEIAPGRFTWRKYPDQINIEHVRTFLSDAKKAKNGVYLSGSGTDGWILTREGLLFARSRVRELGTANLRRNRLSSKDKQWLRTERTRLLASDAYQKVTVGALDSISTRLLSGCW